MNVGETFVRMALDSRDYEKGMARMEKYTQQKGTLLGNIFAGAFSVAAGIAIAKGFQILKNSISDLLITAAQVETFNVAMLAVARSTGHTTQVVEQQKRAIMDLGIAEKEAAQITTRFMQSQIDLADAVKIVRIAQDAGAISGMNSSDAAMQMVESIAKLRPELLNAFGMTRNLNSIYSDFAKTLGKKATQLTEIQKKQAMVNYIFKEGAKIAGSYEAAMGTFGKKLGSMEKLMLSKKLMQELKSSLGGPILLPAAGFVLDALYDKLKQLQAWIDDNKTRLQYWGQVVLNVFKNVAAVAMRVFNVIGNFAKFVVRNWTFISRAAMVAVRAFLLFKIVPVIMLAASKATMYFSSLIAILQGRAMGLRGSLRVLSAGLEYYRYQLHLANMAGITSVGVAAKVSLGIKSIGIAIKGLLASIPVIGWIVLAIGLLAEAAIYAYHNFEKVKHYGLQAWSALKQGIAYYIYGILSLYRLLFGWIPGIGAAFDVLRKKALDVAKAETEIRKARAGAYGVQALDPYKEYERKMDEYYKQLEDYEAKLESSFTGAKDGADDTTDSIEKMNKAAGSGIQSFDEVHQLMEKTGDAAGGLDDLGLDLGLEGMPKMPEMPAMPSLDEAGFLEKISGMWADITSGISTGVADAWADFSTTGDEALTAFKNDWNNFWGKIDLKKWWNEKIAPWFTKAKWLELYDNMLISLKETSDAIGVWWNNSTFGKWWNKYIAPWFTKEKWLELYDNMLISLHEKSDALENWWNNSTFGKWWNKYVSPWFTKEKWLKLYDNMVTSLHEKSDELETWWNNSTFGKWWNEHVFPWFTKDRWLGLYDNMLTSLHEKSDELETWWNNSTFGKWWNKYVFPWFTKDRWLELYDNMRVALEETWAGIKTWWNNTTYVKWWNESVAPWFEKTKWLDLYSSMKIAMEDVWNEIEDWWNGTLIGKAFNWGKNLIGNFIDGIKEKARNVGSTLSNTADVIKDYLGFSSPTRLGPGRYADQWAPNLMKMLTEGIEKNLPKFQVAVNYAASALPGISAEMHGAAASVGPGVDDLEQAVYRAFINALRVMQASSSHGSGNDDKELVLKIDNTVLARMQLPAIIREGQRQGLNLVVQGV